MAMPALEPIVNNDLPDLEPVDSNEDKTEIDGYQYIRQHGLPDWVRRDLENEFRHGQWSRIWEYGDRNGKLYIFGLGYRPTADEPCVRIREVMHKRHGMFAYQAAYVLYHGKPRSRKEVTACCTISHMKVGKDQAENRECQDCHADLKILCNSFAQTNGSGSLKGAYTIQNCPHNGKGQFGSEYCILSYGQSAPGDSVETYVLTG